MATTVKTLRLPPDVIDTIEGFPGDSFTDKFVSAARLLGRDRQRLEKELHDLEQERQQKLLRLADIGKLSRKRDSIQRSLDEISWKMSDLAKACTSTCDTGVHILQSDSSDSKEWILVGKEVICYGRSNCCNCCFSG